VSLFVGLRGEILVFAGMLVSTPGTPAILLVATGLTAACGDECVEDAFDFAFDFRTQRKRIYCGVCATVCSVLLNKL
jgi:hypothetical protein